MRVRRSAVVCLSAVAAVAQARAGWAQQTTQHSRRRRGSSVNSRTGATSASTVSSHRGCKSAPNTARVSKASRGAGFSAANDDAYWLGRFPVERDSASSESVKFFVQTQDARHFDRKRGACSRRSAYARPPTGVRRIRQSTTVRIGRQELAFGARTAHRRRQLAQQPPAPSMARDSRPTAPRADRRVLRFPS